MTGREEGTGHAVQCPADDRRRFQRFVAASPALADLGDRGSRQVRTFPRLLTDVFAVFYSPDPILCEEAEVGVDRLQYLIVKYLCESPEYQRLREKTALEFDAAAAAAEAFGRRLLEFLEHWQPSGGRGSAAPTGEVHITAITFADTVVVGDGSPLDEALLVIGREIEGDADSLRCLCDLCWRWGTERGFLQQLPFEERMALARRVRDTQKLQELARIVGRMRALAMQKQQTRVAALPHEVYDVTLGRDWDALLAHELASLAHPALRYDFYERLIDGRVAQYELRGEETCEQGSIVACVDTSGSMAGRHELVAKAIALALVDVARLQRRRATVILFSSAGEWRSFGFADDVATVHDPGGTDETVSLIDAIVRVGSEFFGGGTDYESPLHEAIRVIGHEEANDADIVFITDDQCEVTDAFRDEFAAVKKTKQFAMYGVIVGAMASEARTLKALSDDVLAAADLTDAVAERIFERI